jgi:hypothetical protein
LIEAGAIIDISSTYRYLLWRSWDQQRPRLGFMMLNPSTADATQDDPTIRRCLGFAHAWGYGSLEVVNLFAYRSPTPKALGKVPDPVGPENDRYLLACTQRVQTLILAWGNHGSFHNRHLQVLSLLADGQPLYCLGLTQAGQPRHPLYLSRNTIPVCKAIAL